uniref:mannose-1-phosphate guanylyltransferase/mannose-6-phosphate isomerase n=1 Tax=Stappia sp. TaxID=1870903 RepID=UPI003BA9A258
MSIIPCILSGGSGSRLWPMSRSMRPKQFLPMFDGESLFQKTLKRFASDHFASPLVICNADHRFLVGEQMAGAGRSGGSIVLEPIGRNTAAPAALAALLAFEQDDDALVLLAPSDHLVARPDLFVRAVEAAEPAARAGNIVTFGISPSEPNTGYGYIRLKPEEGDVRPVEAFVEKPDRQRAETFLADGNYVWNAGIFLFSARAMIEEFERQAPEVLSGTRAALTGARRDLDFLRLDAEAFAAVPDISIDYAIMEHCERIMCVPVDPGWNDLGSWSAVWETLEKGEEGNSALGEAMFLKARDNLVISDEALVSVIGLEKVMVIATKDAVLVANQDNAQDVKTIVDRLKVDGRREVREHRRAWRPWGSREEIASGERFQVQEIEIKPGASLTEQSHVNRAEHWVVVSGTLEITIEGERHLITENQSAYAPVGARHRLANPGRVATRVIEIQSGAYIGDDDIVRYADEGSEPSGT